MCLCHMLSVINYIYTTVPVVYQRRKATEHCLTTENFGHEWWPSSRVPPNTKACSIEASLLKYKWHYISLCIMRSAPLCFFSADQRRVMTCQESLFTWKKCLFSGDWLSAQKCVSNLCKNQIEQVPIKVVVSHHPSSCFFLLRPQGVIFVALTHCAILAFYSQHTIHDHHRHRPSRVK